MVDLADIDAEALVLVLGLLRVIKISWRAIRVPLPDLSCLKKALEEANMPI
jgi:hypothetical protein